MFLGSSFSFFDFKSRLMKSVQYFFLNNFWYSGLQNPSPCAVTIDTNAEIQSKTKSMNSDSRIFRPFNFVGNLESFDQVPPIRNDLKLFLAGIQTFKFRDFFNVNFSGSVGTSVLKTDWLYTHSFGEWFYSVRLPGKCQITELHAPK